MYITILKIEPAAMQGKKSRDNVVYYSDEKRMNMTVLETETSG